MNKQKISLLVCTALITLVTHSAAREEVQYRNYIQEEVALASLDSNSRQLNSLNWVTIVSDTKFSCYWSWFTGWSTKQTTFQPNELNYNHESVSNTLAYSIVQRKACVNSKTSQFTTAVQIAWYTIISLSAEFTWGFSCSSHEGYQSYADNLNNCNLGQYQSGRQCYSCPVGCASCSGPQQCTQCVKNYTYVQGYDFGFCFPDCSAGQYMQTLYTDDNSFKQANKCQVTSVNASTITGLCSACPSGCADCVYNEDKGQSQCYQCFTGFVYNINSGTCDLAPCSLGQFRPKIPSNNTAITSNNANANQYACQNCPNGCSNCSSSTTCNTCIANFIMTPSSATMSGQCIPCPQNCQQCVLSNNLQAAVCQKCSPHFQSNIGGTQCFLNRTCATGQWFNDITLTCQSCPANSLTCQESAINGTVQVLTCTPDMMPSNNKQTCVSRCNINTQFFNFTSLKCVSCNNLVYPDQANQKCQPCYQNCVSCFMNFFQNATSNTLQPVQDCYICANGTFYDYTHRKCRSSCNATSYYDFNQMKCINCGPAQYVNSGTQTCSQCPTNCTSCTQTSSILNTQVTCTSCSKGNVVDQTYQTCRPNCTDVTTYFNWNTKTCKTCSAGTVIDYPKNQCDYCPAGCSSCFRNQSTGNVQCNSCIAGYTIEPVYNLCRPQCASWQTFYYQTFSCRQCPPYQSLSYDTNTCKNCSFGCLSCLGEQNGKKGSCITCDSSTIFDVFSFQCKLPCNSTTTFNYATNTCQNCPAGQYMDQIFQQCMDCSDSNCATCYLKNNMNYGTTCSQCVSGYQMDSNGICRPACPTNSYYNIYQAKCVSCQTGTYYSQSLQQCIICPLNCLSCSFSPNQNLVACNSCNSNLILDPTSSTCRTKCSSSKPFYNNTIGSCTTCPSNTYFNSTSMQCTPCPANCSSCIITSSGSIQCSGCLNKWILDDVVNQCKPQCPSNQQYNWNTLACSYCPAGQWLNATLQKCNSCPTNCGSCSYYSTNNTYQCGSCQNGYVLDQQKLICRTPCSSSQYYDWTMLSCQSCPVSQFVNPQSQQCTQCPSNCNSCLFNSSTQQIKCQTCQSGYVLDSQVLKCKLPCNSTTYFNWGTNQCQSCSSGTFLNPTYGSCQTCPSGCTSCSYDPNANQIDCQTCASGLIVDQNMQLCRQPCNNTAYYDWTYNTCINCQSNQYLDPSSQTCMQCQGNCLTCLAGTSNTSSTVQCTTCPSGTVLDQNVCRQACNSTSYYDWTQGQCIQCNNGQWLNTNTMQCQYCPLGCFTCSANSTNSSSAACQICLPTLILSQNICRPQCTSSQPFYNSTVGSCVACPQSSIFNTSTQTCVQCPPNCSSCNQTSSGLMTCNGCLNNWFLDDVVNQCKPPCPANTSYSWSTSSCNQCPSGQWLNTTLQECNSCPKNCGGCNYYINNNTFQCSYCTNGNVLDQQKQICRPACSSTQYYNWTTSSCASCSLTQYLNPSTQQCSTCPQNCASCFFNTSSQNTQCQTCSSGYVLDSSVLQCKLPCSSSTYYNWTTSQCQSCSAGSYLNQALGSCQACPSGCATCVFNQQSNQVQCQTCSNGSILDQKMLLCRPQCNNTAYYNWTQNICVNCQSNQYLDPNSLSCQSCQGNCQTCQATTSSNIQCTSCPTGTVLDQNICRQACNSTSFYNWTQGQCVQCNSGQWLNPNTQQCQQCSSGCSSCVADASNNSTSDCTSCIPNLVLSQNICIQNCSSSQYYNWTIGSCISCTYPCTACSTTYNQCTTCDSPYNLQQNGTCTSKCIIGQQIWSNASMSCVATRILNVSVVSSIASTLRCRTATINAKPLNLTAQDSPIYIWSYQIKSGGLNQSNWALALNQIIAQANSNNAIQLAIPSNFTMLVIDNTTFNFSVQMTVGMSSVTNSTTFNVVPSIYTTITNYSTSYSISANVGLPLQAAFFYPECPVGSQGPVAIPSNINIGCNLYDSNANLIMSLAHCQIPPNDVSNGLTYYIKYYYVPNTYQAALKDTITINVIAIRPSCSIANASLVYVFASGNLNLNVTVLNQLSGFVYTWQCTPLTSSSQCGIVQTTQNSASLSLPASTLTNNGAYNFTLNITANSVYQTSCSANVQVISPPQIAFNLAYIDNANTRNYIDPTLSQNIMCYQSQDLLAFVEYDWSVQRLSDGAYIYNSLSTKQSSVIQATANDLVINPNTLSTSGDYYNIMCNASNLKYYGSITKTYTTSLILNTAVKFSVSPTSGTAQSTQFTLTVTKPSGYNLWCSYGYVTPSGNIQISNSQTPTFPSSSQSLVTTLNYTTSSIVTLYTMCNDSTNAYTMAYFNVTIIQQASTLTAKLSSSSPTVKGSFLEENPELTTQYQFNDLIASYSSITQLNNNTINQAEQIMPMITLFMQEVQQLSSGMTSSQIDLSIQMMQQVLKISSQQDNYESAIEQALIAFSSILSPDPANLTVLSVAQYQTILESISSILDISQVSALVSNKLHGSLLNGAARLKNLITGQDLQVNSTSYIAKIIKITRDNFMQQGELIYQFNIPWMSESIISNIPYNIAYDSFQNLILVELITNSNQTSPYRSDQLSISVFGQVSDNSQVSQIDIHTQNEQILIQFSSSSGVCSVLNEDNFEWNKLDCLISSQPSDDQTMCCSNSLGTFALIEEAYFIQQSNDKFQLIYMVLIPSSVALVLLISAIVICAPKMLRKSAEKTSDEGVKQVDTCCDATESNIVNTGSPDKKQMLNRSLKVDQIDLHE